MRPAPTLGEHTAQVVADLGGDVSSPAAAANGAKQRRKPLEGVRVIDFTNAVAGPIASFILGDLGADVIKIEPPNGRPRNAAGTAPLAEGGEDIPYDRIMTFNELNHGKRGVSLDLARPEGRDLFLKLVAASDAVVQNFSPRVMHNLGLDYDRLREVKPDIILVSMPAFGLDGHYRDRIAYGPGIDAMSGLAHRAMRMALP
jgi:crotonobetainyl-CoA:carnitine CoA-transferase CaiB-like acyl-CoA transferase